MKKKGAFVKRLVVILSALLVLSIIGGCGAEIQGTSISAVAEQAGETADEVLVEGTKYVLTLEVKQSHFTLDLDEHLKDATNKLEIQVPVDKEYYNSVNVGDNIADSFRIGSLIFKGSFGNWKVKVKDKEIVGEDSESLDGTSDVESNDNTEKYVLTLKIKQSHLTLDLDEHFKDAANALEIQIPVDKDYYDSVDIGDNIADSFRMGSLVFKGSFGSWKVSVSNKEIM